MDPLQHKLIESIRFLRDKYREGHDPEEVIHSLGQALLYAPPHPCFDEVLVRNVYLALKDMQDHPEEMAIQDLYAFIVGEDPLETDAHLEDLIRRGGLVPPSRARRDSD